MRTCFLFAWQIGGHHDDGEHTQIAAAAALMQSDGDHLNFEEDFPTQLKMSSTLPRDGSRMRTRVSSTWRG